MNHNPCAALTDVLRAEPYAQLLGTRIDCIAPGQAVISLDVTRAHCNLFGTVHGGAIFSLIDEAFAAACNSHGTVAVALNCNVSFLAPAYPGDQLCAQAVERSCGARVATYDIQVTNQDDVLIATCSAMAYRKKDALPFLAHSSPAGQP